MALHTDFGKEAERLSCVYLEGKGYKILRRNYRYRQAEIDIIAQQGDVLVVVEVKARSTEVFGSPESFVTKKKMQLLTEAIDYFCTENNWESEVRFDIISVLKTKTSININHINDAFSAFEWG